MTEWKIHWIKISIALCTVCASLVGYTAPTPRQKQIAANITRAKPHIILCLLGWSVSFGCGIRFPRNLLSYWNVSLFGSTRCKSVVCWVSQILDWISTDVHLEDWVIRFPSGPTQLYSFPYSIKLCVNQLCSTSLNTKQQSKTPLSPYRGPFPIEQKAIGKEQTDCQACQNKGWKAIDGGSLFGLRSPV